MANGNLQAPAANTGTSPGTVTLESDYARGQLEDALALCRYAVGNGLQLANGDPLPLDAVAIIQGTAACLGILKEDAQKSPTDGLSISTADWVAFEQAYYRLAVLTSPVTAETLAATRATRPGPNEPYNLRNRILGYSPAVRFTSVFALGAIAIAAFVVAGECVVYYWGLEPDTTKYGWQRNLVQTLLPWAYGALGSCAYLLRSAHYFIHQRCFDLRRRPEYFNRVLLGAISGGAIILFVDYLVNEDDGTVLHLSSAAFGFIAGYSTDFLFNTIERVVAAIFPKTDSDPNAGPPKGKKLPVQRHKSTEPAKDGQVTPDEAAGTRNTGARGRRKVPPAAPDSENP
jgi:hypothetical protein